MKTEETKQKIQETFFSLSQTMPMKKITVSKLCQACQISRSTFYLHYDNVDDLTDYLEKELLYRIEKLLKKEQHIPLEEFQNQTFFHLLTYIDAHLSEFQFLISKQDSAEFIARLSNEPFTSIRLSYRNLQIGNFVCNFRYFKLNDFTNKTKST